MIVGSYLRVDIDDAVRELEEDEEPGNTDPRLANILEVLAAAMSEWPVASDLWQLLVPLAHGVLLPLLDPDERIDLVFPATIDTTPTRPAGPGATVRPSPNRRLASGAVWFSDRRALVTTIIGTLKTRPEVTSLTYEQLREATLVSVTRIGMAAWGFYVTHFREITLFASAWSQGQEAVDEWSRLLLLRTRELQPVWDGNVLRGYARSCGACRSLTVRLRGTCQTCGHDNGRHARADIDPTETLVVAAETMHDLTGDTAYADNPGGYLASLADVVAAEMTGWDRCQLYAPVLLGSGKPTAPGVVAVLEERMILAWVDRAGGHTSAVFELDEIRDVRGPASLEEGTPGRLEWVEFTANETWCVAPRTSGLEGANWLQGLLDGGLVGEFKV